MKKSLWILMLLCMALFALPALATETTCEHASIHCTGVCEDCGTTDLTTDNPLHAQGEIFTDDTQCWSICDDCGQQCYLMNHQTYCYMNGECIQCETTTGTIELIHSGSVDGTWQTDGENHWELCACGEIFNLEPHHVYCTDSGVCSRCYATNCTSDPVHTSIVYSYDATSHFTDCGNCGTRLSEGEHVDFYYSSDSNYHYKHCGECNYSIESESHSAPCNSDGSCATCGVATTWLTHNWTYKSDDNYHWEACDDCGADDWLDNGWRSEHYAACDSSMSSCIACGYATTNLEKQHVGPLESGYDDTYHYEKCTYCQENSFYEKHYILCDNNDASALCALCGVEATAYEIGHYSGAWCYDDEQHWRGCEACGEPDNASSGTKQAHYVTCQSLGACDICWMEPCPAPMVHVGVVDDTWYSDGENHYQLCACGEKINTSAHSVFCANPGVCTECGATGCTNEETHAGINDTWVTDDMYHWMDCSACGQQVDLGNHTNMAITFESNDTHCWQICDICSIEYNMVEHHAICPDDGVCSYCDTAFGGEAEHWVDSAPEYEFDSETHWYYCDGCGTELGTTPHDVACNASGVCSVCGATGCTNDPTHSLDVDTPQSRDDTHHWYECEACGEKLAYSEHWVICTEPTVCVGCSGTVGEGISVPHSYDYETYNSNETDHWNECTDCGAQIRKSAHNVSCANPGVCAVCGAASDLEPEHLGAIAYEYGYDESTHWHKCADCDMPLEDPWDHMVSCQDLTHCKFCGAENEADAFFVTHNASYDSFEYDETYCWVVCEDCGAETSKSYHNAVCNNPGVCERCGIAWDGEAQHVPHVDTLTYDENYCWYLCAYCGEEVEKDTHFGYCSNPDVCVRCGAAVSDSASVMHDYDYSTRKYDETHCWNECSGCGDQTQKYEHYAVCTNPGVCADCGVAFATENVAHFMYSTDPWYSEGDYHWQLCNACGEQVNYSTHDLLCDGSTNGRCFECGMFCVDDNPLHVGRFESAYDTENHFLACTVCGLQINVEAHIVSCLNPGVCTECGATGCTNDPQHAGSFEIEYDETRHWEVCSSCGEVAWEGGEHYNTCISGLPLGRCVECDYDQVTTFYHTYDGGSIGEAPQTTWNYNEAECWQECIGCNAEMADTRFPHHTSCEEPGVCTACGTEVGDDIEMMHYRYADTPYEYDETHHWFICVMCNEPAMKGEHNFRETERDESKVVYTCGCGATKEEQLHTEHVWIESGRVEASCGVKGEIIYICECGETKTEEIPALEHSYTTAETPATCTEDGSKVTDCANCDDSKTEVIPATGHDYSVTETPATCTEDGSKVTVCTNCDDSKTEVIPATGHDYSVTETPATCTEDGSKVTVCANCDDSKTEIIPATGHDYSVTETPATCTEDGSKVTVCANCDDSKTEIIPATGHDYSVTETPATCTEDGSKVTVCANCDDSTTEIIPATGHDYSVTETPATCTENGAVVSVCRQCNHMLVDTIPALNHNWQRTNRKLPTCTVAGTTYYTCSNCNMTDTETLPAKGHSHTTTETAATCTQDGAITTTCANCDDVQTEILPATGHSYAVTSETAATCTTEGAIISTCAHCGEEQTEIIPAAGHSYAVTSETAPACTTEGAIISTCAHCGEEQTEIIPMLSHTFGAYVSTGNGTHTAACECGETRVRECDYHDVTTSGITLTVCTVCGHTRYAMLPTITPPAAAQETVAPANTTEPADNTDTTVPAETTQEEVTPNILYVPEKVEAVVETETLPAGAQLTVYSQTNMLDESSPILAMYTIGLESDGYAVQPESTMRVQITMEETMEEADFEGYRLVVIGTDGSITEIEYTIEDGKIIFETDLVGIFAFLPIEE